MTKCPVCDGDMTLLRRDMLDGHTVCEEEMACPSGHYSFQYAYGSTRAWVGEEHFDYFYSEGAAERNQQMEAEELAAILRLRAVALEKEGPPDG